MGRRIHEVQTAKLSFFLLLFLLVDGMKLSNREYLSMKRKLRILNKPGVKVIKTKYGDIYDCVDIHKQPALDHPLLKNHTVQMAPTNYLPEISKKDVSGLSGGISVNMTLPDGGCPEGTVPLLRLSIQDLIRAKSMRLIRRAKHDLLNGGYFTDYQNVDDRYYQHFALVRTPGDREYHGLKATMNIWGPTVQNYQFSSAGMWFYGGPVERIHVIETGWMVNPTLYPDARSRVFVFWTSNRYRNGCYDRQCEGFVHVSKDFPIPSYIEPLSTYDGDQYEVTLQLYKDPKTNRWWLTFGENQAPVGYWPSELFPYMRDSASQIHWGGEVAGLTDSFPPMGSGHYAQSGFKRSCYMKNIKMVNREGRHVDVPRNTHLFLTDASCYNIYDYLGKDEGDTGGRHIFFGGPGGRCHRRIGS